MKKILLLVVMLFSIQFSNAQDDNQFVSKSFLIVLSSKNYNQALKKAQLASNKLGYPLDLRNMYADKENGLTTSEVCGCGEQHGYLARGRGDDGNYISIEYSDYYDGFSDYYDGFSEGYYMVIVSSGERNQVSAILPKVKKHYKDAYVKNAPVYTGCMH